MKIHESLFLAIFRHQFHYQHILRLPVAIATLLWIGMFYDLFIKPSTTGVVDDDNSKPIRKMHDVWCFFLFTVILCI